jgi:hypothetical protein
MVCVLGVLLLTSACSSSDDGPPKGAKVEDVKASVDDLTMKVLPALAKAFDGEFPLARGKFIECGVGPNFQRYEASGELHSQVKDNAEAAEKIRSALSDAGIDATIDADSTVKGKTGDITILVETDVMAADSLAAIRSVTIASKCRTYAGADADRIDQIEPKVYGEPVTGTS